MATVLAQVGGQTVENRGMATLLARTIAVRPVVLAAALVGIAAAPAAAVPPPLEPPAPAPLPAPVPPEPETPAPAQPTAKRTIFVFNGRGWGHGIGMSQYGARGRALAGWTTGRILRHYYRGTALRRVPARRIKVLLHTSVARGQVTSDGPWRVVTEGAGRRARNLRPGTVYRVVVRGGRVEVLGPGGGRVAAARSSLRFEPRGRSILTIRRPGGLPYRGWLRFRRRGNLTDVINAVPLTQYLQGVVPREMPSAWGDDAPAALRAQAIAARSYALATRRRSGAFDVYTDTRSQVYGGLLAEDPRTNAAVRATRRVVIVHRGQVIPAFFFSTSGGRTENNENVWAGQARPYLRSVPDRFDRISPLHRWPDRPAFTPEQLGRSLGLGEAVTALRVTERGRSPRVKKALVVARSGRRVTLTGAQMKARLGLRETWFSVSRRRVTPAVAKELLAG